MKNSLILAIETSCDETSAAVVRNGSEILSNVVATQIESHKRFGGVVPEVASRHHVEQILYCIDEALYKANVTAKDLTSVAVTYGPGLVGALLVGVSAAKAYAFANDLPLIAVNHMFGHLCSVRNVTDLKFPLLALLVSGGHTELVLMTSLDEQKIIGQTRDDAVGEAYDKVGRVLGLKYPAGREIDELAHTGDDIYNLPRPMIDDDSYDFSFSGIKSAVINLNHNAEQKGEKLEPKHLAASFQQAVIDVLVKKTLKAAEEYNVKQLVVAGGVAANKGLKEALEAKTPENIELIITSNELSGDNAAMIGMAAAAQEAAKDFADLDLNALPSLSFEEE
ncbi:MAG: tRNA (adenosine(37)-N6)-threonylcarbamoyltransferase complex transferase subunit TsaD [Lactobacillales bacterium]|jgi:N6-L-threonylcarbamoyladenine synthase|nr:tRNA (adenosine(37)-N6)-threonylcarbamoyltransferase complex transferase subunit TsaD [Lactobacillales bacterium]